MKEVVTSIKEPRGSTTLSPLTGLLLDADLQREPTIGNAGCEDVDDAVHSSRNIQGRRETRSGSSLQWQIPDDQSTRFKDGTEEDCDARCIWAGGGLSHNTRFQRQVLHDVQEAHNGLIEDWQQHRDSSFDGTTLVLARCMMLSWIHR